MSARKPPIKRGLTLTRSDLTNRVYGVVRWRDLGNGRIEAIEKYDITEELQAVADDLRAIEFDPAARKLR